MLIFSPAKSVSYAQVSAKKAEMRHYRNFLSVLLKRGSFSSATDLSFLSIPTKQLVGGTVIK